MHSTPPRTAELPEFYEALQALLRVYQFRDRDSACYGDVTPHDCYALAAIERAGELPVSRLAAELALHKSNASRIASSLARRGYVSRRTAAGDGRTVLLALTALGRLRHDAVRRRVQAAQGRILRRFPTAARREFVRLLRELQREAESRLGGSRRKRC